MKDIRVFCQWESGVDLKHEKQIEFYIDQIPTTPIPNDTIRILLVWEPIEIKNLNGHATNAYKSTYNFLMTHNKELLQKVSGAYLFPIGTCWIKDYDFPEKNFSVSTLVGGKLLAPGHHLRQKMWYKEDRIKNVPTNFFLSGNYSGNLENFNNNPILGSNKADLFGSQFHICIENTKRDNWFTEKLIDCFQTKSVPIYWGCPNIGDWFDTRGMIIVDSVSEAIEACNSLTPDTYEKMSPFIEENFERSKEFCNIDERMKNKIIEILEQNNV
jgi:hypothetical protein